MDQPLSVWYWDGETKWRTALTSDAFTNADTSGIRFPFEADNVSVWQQKAVHRRTEDLRARILAKPNATDLLANILPRIKVVTPPSKA
jgi:hypothetical protein